jgi:hypothetical protein
MTAGGNPGAGGNGAIRKDFVVWLTNMVLCSCGQPPAQLGELRLLQVRLSEAHPIE